MTSAERIKELRNAIENYKPGETIRVKSKRPRNPPKQTRIALFGATGVGKSALINGFRYVTGKIWNEEASEAYQTEQTNTMKRRKYDLTDHLAVCDNRGLRDFCGKYMTEVVFQLGGRRNDGEYVEWDHNFLRRLTANLELALVAKEQCKIHCAVLVVSAKALNLKPCDLKELVGLIVRITGQPPVVIITNKDSICKKQAQETMNTFKSGLRELNIEYVYEIENYTKADHFHSESQHFDLLEALYQCTVIADKNIKHIEEQGGCTIL